MSIVVYSHDNGRRCAVPTIKQTATSTWSDLPDDLLVMVYSRLTTTTPHDRLGFTATCRSWRAATIAVRHPVRSTLPRLIYGSDDTRKRSLYIPQDDGGILNFWLPNEALDKKFAGFHDGGWVVALDWQLGIINLFSGLEVPLSADQMRGPMCGRHSGACAIQKIIFSKCPTSEGCILAAITPSCGLALCGVGCPDSGWTTKHLDRGSLIDIAFCNGELYGLMPYNELVKFDISVKENGAPTVIGDAHSLTDQAGGRSEYPSYIVELHGEIALVVRTGYGGESMFKVFELVVGEITPYDIYYKWAKVYSLGDYALFLGQVWSKAAYVPKGGRGVVHRNYIHTHDGVYFMTSANYGGRVYHMQHARNGIWLERGLAGYPKEGSPQSGMWILPPDF